MIRSKLPPLLYADTASSPDQLYFSRVQVPDPFIAFGAGRRRITVQSSLEFGRILRAGTFDRVLSLEAWQERARQRHPGSRAGVAEIIVELARAHRVAGFRVADDFPVGLFLRLRELGLRVETADGPLFPAREVKSDEEAKAIRAGNRLSAIGLAAARDILRASRIKGRRLVHRGRPLTSESLRFAVDSAILAAGGRPDNTIAAGGAQACDPHEMGHGPLRPRELIIVDVFPRVAKTGYFGDMTRTFLKGRASDAQRRLVATVREAQREALKTVRAGIDGRRVHRRVVDTFSAAGYETRQDAKGSVGFFHGTGHGLGLAVHEAPRLNAVVAVRLKAGTVVTIEPGLYYPGLGGCRIEDVVQVKANGVRLLSRFGYDWEIR